MAASYRIDSSLSDDVQVDMEIGGGSGAPPLKKVENRTFEAQKLSHLPSRHPVYVEFDNISYSVSEGSFFSRNKGERVSSLFEAKLKMMSYDEL